MIFTGLTGFCLIYKLLGLSTYKSDVSKNSSKDDSENNN